MLTPLQEQIARLISAIPEAQGFALAGGAALIARGQVERRTRDLDFFGEDSTEVDILLPALETAAQEVGLTVSRVQVGSGFARLEVSDAEDRTLVDLAVDARLFPTEAGPFGQILSAEELGVDKVLAIFGRTEARDFVDLQGLVGEFGLDHLCAQAKEKDRGFDLRVFRQMLGRFSSIDAGEFDLDEKAYSRLLAVVGDWQREIDRLLIRSKQTDLSYERDLGHGFEY